MASPGSVRAGQGYVELSLNDSALQAGLNQAKATLASFGKGVAAVGAGLAAFGGAITAPFLYGLSVLEEMGGAIKVASRETGIGFEEIGALAAGLRAPLDDVVKGIAKMDSFLQSVADGSSAHAERLDQLGLSFEELNNATQHERILLFADALNKVADAGQRTALKREIFGRGGGVLNFEGGRGRILEREQRARADGTVLTAEQVKMADDYGKALTRVKFIIRGLWASVGSAAAPFMTKFLTWVAEMLVKFKQWLDTMRPTLAIIFRFADIAVTIGTALVALGGGLLGTAAGFGFLATALPFLIVGFKVIAIGAAVLLGAIIAVALPALGLYLILSEFPALGEQIVSAFSGFGNYMSEWIPLLQAFGSTFMATWDGIVSAISAGQLGLAFNIAWIGIKLLWTKGVNGLYDGWLSFCYLLSYGMSQLGLAILGPWTTITKSIALALVWVVGRVVETINQAIEAIPSWLREELGVGTINLDEAALRNRVEQNADTMAGTARRLLNEGPQNWQNAQNQERERARAQEAAIGGEADFLAAEASTAALVAEMDRQARRDAFGAGDEGSAGFSGKIKDSVMGTFSADAALGLLGGESQASRMERLEDQQLRQMELIRAVLERIDRRGGLAFS